MLWRLEGALDQGLCRRQHCSSRPYGCHRSNANNHRRPVEPSLVVVTLFVALEVAGSNPVIHPNKSRGLQNRFSSRLCGCLAVRSDSASPRTPPRSAAERLRRGRQSLPAPCGPAPPP
jgi:hypothetical protein